MIERLKVKLNAISSFNRSLPFWAWNDDLNQNELNDQIHSFSEQGMGGFFIHSREGLEIRYLGKEWFAFIDTILDEAKRLGLELWMYDEDKWPSGSAGGQVSTHGDGAYTAKVLSMERVVIPDSSAYRSLYEEEGVLGIYQCEERSNTFSMLGPEDDASLEVCLVARIETSRPSDWYNGLAPTDMMNPEAVACFLDLTHQAYVEQLGDLKERGVVGFFTDEPNVYDFFTHITPARPYLPWSTYFLNEFENKRGYSILAGIPYLFLPGEAGEVLRFDYWRTVSELFVQSYTEQVSEWCHRHGLKISGHYLYENDLGYQIRTSGSVMDHYRHLDLPAIDLLGDQRQEYLTVKQCTSVARQFKKQHVLTETYGCTGWDVTFATQKYLGDWQYIMGVTRRCQHLALYSIAGCRKRDYPPSFNYQSPWWPHMHHLEEYFARLSVIATYGEVVRDILIIHPLSTLWMESRSSLEEDIGRIEMNMGWLDEHLVGLNRAGEFYNGLAALILGHFYDFDFGDEGIIADSGVVTTQSFNIAHAAYSVVIVPPVHTLFSSTLSLLEDFAKDGGTIIWMGKVAQTIDARPSQRAITLAKRCVTVKDESELLSTLPKYYTRSLTVTDRTGFLLQGFLNQNRNSGVLSIYLVSNQKEVVRPDVRINIYHPGEIRAYDPFANRWEIVHPIEVNKKGMSIETTFNPCELKVFIVDTTASVTNVTHKPIRYHHPHQNLQIYASMPPVCAISLTADNALVLDKCSCIVDGVIAIEEEELWIVQKRLREALGMRQIYMNGAPQRYTWINQSKQRYRTTFTWRFFVAEIPEDQTYLAVEKPKGYTIACNNDIATETDRWFIDRSIRCFALPRFKLGENFISITLDYIEETEFEEIYIIGNFGVSRDREIQKQVTTLAIGDWTLQGLRHYPANVIYTFTSNTIPRHEDPIFFCVTRFKATLLLLSINGSEQIPILHENTPIRINEFLNQDGHDTFSVEVVGSLVNLLGPLHRSATACSRISWEDFRTTGTLYTPYHQRIPQGILDQVIIYANPKYSDGYEVHSNFTQV